MTPQTFIFMGRSGSGKGTQAELLMEYLKKNDPDHGIIYMQTGQELRQFIKGNTLTQQITKGIYEKGGLMPEFIAIYQWIKLMVEKFTGNEHLVFDGAARKSYEAAILMSIFDFYKMDKPWIVYLDVHDEEAIKRLLARKRSDDGLKEIKNRLAWFKTDVEPALKVFREHPGGRFLDIDGVRSIQEIHEDILKRTGLK